MSVVDRLNAQVRRVFMMQEPMRTLFAPRFEFEARGEEIVLTLRITTVDRDYGTRLEGLASHHPVTPYWADRMLRRRRDFARFLRDVLVKTLTHEVDESIWLLNDDGEAFARAFEPEHWGPPT